VLVLVDDLERPVLITDDRRHLERSLRLRPGDPLTVADGAGSWRPAAFGDEIEPTGPIVAEPERARRLVVGFAPVKGDRSDLVVQKLTELGIDVIVPIVTERSVVRWEGDRAARHRERHLRIAREAAMQSRNPRLPTIESPTPLARFLDAWPGSVLADPDGAEGPAALGERTVVAIGPEGGFSPAELAGRLAVRLPGRILRTETAAITAGVLLVARSS
jgi:16S rRNA (uracil1498-N3)-methyltransferase